MVSSVRVLALPLAALSLSACGAIKIDRLERLLASQDSATAALGQWCATQHIAEPPTIKAQRVIDADDAPSAAVRTALHAAPGEKIAYRHVRLNCGAVTLSLAHNWYLPDRLPVEMNRRLETTDTPFGQVVTPLHFTRERLASQRGVAEGCPAATVLSHRAMLKLPDGRPFSLLVECYTEANLS